MGSFGGPVNETPQHPVKVDMYYIDLYEVDNVQFDHFARESAFVWKDHPYLADELLSNRTSRCWLKRNWKPSYAECLESHPSHTGTYLQMDIDYFKEYLVNLSEIHSHFMIQVKI
jgi:formylglycine-generating enzyme required for sulfatase activity